MDGFRSRHNAPATGPDLPTASAFASSKARRLPSNGFPPAGRSACRRRRGDVQVAYGWKQIPLPIALELLEFEVQRNEGNDSPAGFKSTVRVTTPEGQTATGQCWMNNPFSYPGEWWHTWTGLTFKMSQASWNPENLGQSTIQILRDPGWLLKWIGSLLIVCGIFMLFYVKGFRRPSRSAAASASFATARAKSAKRSSGFLRDLTRPAAERRSCSAALAVLLSVGLQLFGRTNQGR